ncbi:hypothetical protein H6P81_020069 [Aristolochia fimbriata]|uniref:Uncharacterized protein n=1 Tax=Aristolochia fimbriata TaxID=158543 RepID=A0AAV7DUH0_ARIFI|nr:hypothetical protein H6P81_020069 [Aristolochia fimbriata]
MANPGDGTVFLNCTTRAKRGKRNHGRGTRLVFKVLNRNAPRIVIFHRRDLIHRRLRISLSVGMISGGVELGGEEEVWLGVGGDGLFRRHHRQHSSSSPVRSSPPSPAATLMRSIRGAASRPPQERLNGEEALGALDMSTDRARRRGGNCTTFETGTWMPIYLPEVWVS